MTGPDTTGADAGALSVLHDLLASRPPTEQGLGVWRWQVRRQLAPLREVIVSPAGPTEDWLAARRGGCQRERTVLVRRLSDLGPRVLHDADLDRLCRDLRHLLDDVRHHEQRCNDLVYDEVELELGGSE
ncbi:hypothetical protein [Nocardioides sp. LHG3406-4]|uniref:hypothetical protein n=1 Tax=Nocardioides sp. LHG3406-4 TaxID=2804575 RepID=UPI003CEE0737